METNQSSPKETYENKIDHINKPTVVQLETGSVLASVPNTKLCLNSPSDKGTRSICCCNVWFLKQLVETSGTHQVATASLFQSCEGWLQCQLVTN